MKTASAHHMKAKLFVLLAIFLSSPIGAGLACSVCYGAKDAKSTAAHGRRHLGFDWRDHVRARWSRRIQFSSLATRAARRSSRTSN